MSKIGYARVSSKEQNLDRQLEALQSVSKVFSDKASGHKRYIHKRNEKN
ncbi:MAG: recombinase family protein [Lactococcus lactis]|nr:recombinase family protein [Lactococcus lactis]MDN6473487.1 recombinase family protein [Lactococcus lactis]MDN6755762.1 recombinase family protein [Lactococcus lactis]MDN6821075.1 recombinase family protein [Lactococcus lactis]